MAQVKEFVTKSFVLLKEHTPAQAFCVDRNTTLLSKEFKLEIHFSITL